MIPRLAELAVLQSKFDAQMSEKKEWLIARQTALDYYKGRTASYTKKYFSDRILNKIPLANVNITKRIIDRTSLVYMVPPTRVIGAKPNQVYDDLTYHKDAKMARMEAFTNLLGLVAMKPTARKGRIEYDIITDFELEYSDSDAMEVVAIHYPVSVRNSVMDTTPEMWAYWDAENCFLYDKAGKIYDDINNPDLVNPYGVLPFVFAFRDGQPETAFTDVDPAADVIQTNLLVNVSETNKMANLLFQSFGRGYLKAQGDTKTLPTEQDVYWTLGPDDDIGMITPPSTIEAIASAINSSYKLLALNYHLPASFVEGTTAESGVALRLRNQELQDDRRTDVSRWRLFEYDLFEIERIIAKVDFKKTITGDIDVDFSETEEVLSPQEQREDYDWRLQNGLIDTIDILMKENPDKFTTRAQAEAYLAERKKSASVVRRGGDTAENIFSLGNG